MAVICEMKEAWHSWLAARPVIVQQLAAQLPPNRLYRLKTSGHRVTLYSYGEDGTVTVAVTGDYNAVAFDRRVFGIKPEDLEECDLPEPGEPLGTLLSDRKEIDEYIGKVVKASWFVYIVRCRDGSLYTGFTSDLEKRVRVHNSGKGAKYTRSRLPVVLVYSAPFEDRSGAMREEARIKKMSRTYKTFLISNTEIMKCQSSRLT